MRRHGRGAMALGIAYMSTSKGNGPGPPWGLPLFRQSALYCHVDIGSRLREDRQVAQLLLGLLGQEGLKQG